MTSPRAPRDPRPQASPAPAPDLTPGERALAARFAGLARAQAPASLARRCLEARPEEVLAARWGGGGFAHLLHAPLQWAAGVLLALGVAALGGSQGPLDAPSSTSPEPVFTSSLKVVDDPSVPLFHAVETFDRLTPAPLVAWSGGGASPAGHGDSGEGR